MRVLACVLVCTCAVSSCICVHYNMIQLNVHGAITQPPCKRSVIYILNTSCNTVYILNTSCNIYFEYYIAVIYILNTSCNIYFEY